MHSNQGENSKVSIITPTHNSSRYIEHTIQGIINQTYEDWELIITDDGSTDETLNIVKHYASNDNRIKLYTFKKSLGPAKARNNSIQMARGRYIAFCDSDDIWYAQKLKKQIDLMIDTNSYFTFSSYNIINENGNIVGRKNVPKSINYKKLLRYNYIGCLTAIYDRHNLGTLYMPLIKKRQDYGLWLNIAKKLPVVIGVQEPLAEYRIHANSISKNKITLLKYNYKIYKDVLGYSRCMSSILILNFLLCYFHAKIFGNIFQKSLNHKIKS